MIVTSARNVTKVIETTISQQIIEKEVESDNEYSTIERKQLMNNIFSIDECRQRVGVRSKFGAQTEA